MEEKSVTIRTAGVKDADKLLEIYAPYVERTAVTFEYEVPLKEEFEKRIQRTLEKYPYLVAESDCEILGYAYAGSFHARPAYDWAVETSIYVKQNQKRKGVGRTLHDALENVLKEQNILNMNACIAYIEKEDEYLTRDSVIFHTHMGYRMVGEFYECGYKFNRWYNMVWMEKHIGQHVKNQPGIREFSKVREIIAEKYNIR